VTQVAAQCGLPLCVAGQHLRALQARGLIRATRQGRWVRYTAEPDPLVRHAAALLAAAMGREPPARVRRALTAYTHPRRIAIVRALAAAPRRPGELAAACRMSGAAVNRHLRKLRRRGVLSPLRGACSLAAPRSRLAARLLKVVCA
jgi:DNA-binding transcriptional ArsR family regulator